MSSAKRKSERAVTTISSDVSGDRNCRGAIILYGGSFDPPHLQHVSILKDAVREIKPEKVFILPSWKSPFKRAHWASFDQRRKMIEIAVKSLKPGKGEIAISDFEFKRKRTTYTCEVIRHFRRKYSGCAIYFLIGSDCYGDFRKWKNYREIMKHAVLLVARRRGFGGKNSEAGTLFLRRTFRGTSSTEVRKEIILSSTSSKVPHGVLAYIRKNNLYLCSACSWLRKNMSRARFAHSFKAAKLAAKIGAEIGMDSSQAAAAALLHDAARDLPVRRIVSLTAPLRIPLKKEIIRREPLLLHSYASAVIAEKRFGIRDREILDAIRYHSAVSTGMRLLDKVVFIADFYEPGRKTGKIKIGRVNKSNFNNLFARTLKRKIEYFKRRGMWIHPETVKLWKENM